MALNFLRCSSLKSRRCFSKMRIVLCLQMQASSRVPSLGAPLVSCSSFRQAALEAVSHLLTEKLGNGPYTSFPYETTQGRNIPPKRTRIQIWANHSHNLENWLG